MDIDKNKFKLLNEAFIYNFEKTKFHNFYIVHEWFLEKYLFLVKIKGIRKIEERNEEQSWENRNTKNTVNEVL